MKIEPTTVTMDIGLYEAYKAAWDAVNNNLDIKIERGYYYVGYIIKSESELIQGLMKEIKILQEVIEGKDKIIMRETKKRKWFNL